MTDDRLGVLEAEVQSLRAEVRRARRFRWAIGLCCLSLGLVAAKLAPSVVRADRFELTDEKGEVRGVLAADENGPYLKLVDRMGGQALLEVRQGEATLFLDKKVNELLPDAPEPQVEVIQPAPLPPEIRVSKDIQDRGYSSARIVVANEDVSFKGVKLFCARSELRMYVEANEDGSVDLPVVPLDDECNVSFSGGHPGRVRVAPDDDLVCERMREGWFNCGPAAAE